MSSKMQLLKDAIDVHSTFRYLQRKFHLQSFHYRRMCTDGEDFDTLLEAKTAGKERLEANNEVFHLGEMEPQQENIIQQNNLELKVKGFRNNETQDQASGREPAYTKTVEMLQLESKSRGFLASNSSCHEHSNSSLEIRELANTETVQKGTLEFKSKGFLSCQEYSNSVSELTIPAKQQVSELRNEGFFEIKLSRTEHPELSPEFRKSKSSAQLQSKNSCEDRDPLAQVRSESGKTQILQKKRSESKLEDFLHSKSSCDENSNFSSEFRRRQLGETKPVQPKDLMEFKTKSIHIHRTNDSSSGNQDSISDVLQPRHLKTIQQKGLEFNLKSFHSSKTSCHENKDSSLALGKSPHAETVQPKNLQSKANDVHCSKTSSNEHSKLNSERKTPKNVKARKKQKMESKSQGFHYSKISCHGEKEVKKESQMKKPVQQKKSIPVHQVVCKVPSWQDDEKVRAKLTQRRTAVCDKIEKELLNQYGMSLRKLRKCIVVEEILKEVNLL